MSLTQSVCALLLMLIHFTSGQSVVINEMSQGSGGGKEWVELLVVDNGVDMRGWELGDNDDGNWHPLAEFTHDQVWAFVLAGTIIVIYNSGDVDETIMNAGGEDTDLADKSLIIGVNNSTYFNDIGPWGGSSGAFANTDADDCAAIRDSNDVIIHDMAVTHPSATVTGPGSAKVKYYTGNTLEGIIGDTNWSEATSSAGTPGKGNGGDNSTWVDSSLPVELSNWCGYVSGGTIVLKWTTESEIENQGFIIYRRNKAQGEMSEIASFVQNTQLLGQGSTTEESNYTFTDLEVEVEQTYAYQLADVDYNGNVTTHFEIEVSIKDDKDDTKNQIIKLHHPHPNPFNPFTHLSFSLWIESDQIRMDIIDMQGRIIKTIINRGLDVGHYDLIWDGLDEMGKLVPGGVYVVRMITTCGVQTQRITLIR